MQAIVRWCLKNKSVVFLAAAILIAAGSYATTRLNQELFPDIEFPLITVSTPVAGAGPDLVDEQVTQPLQSAVEGVEGIESVQATSSPGFSVLVVEFGLDVDTEQAEDEINDAVNGVSLPEQALVPEVVRQSTSQFPVLNVSLSAKDGDLAGVTEYAEDEAIPLIEDVEGVAGAELVGGSERRIEVDLKPAELEERGIPAEAIIGALEPTRRRDANFRGSRSGPRPPRRAFRASGRRVEGSGVLPGPALGSRRPTRLGRARRGPRRSRSPQRESGDCEVGK